MFSRRLLFPAMIAASMAGSSLAAPAIEPSLMTGFIPVERTSRFRRILRPASRPHGRAKNKSAQRRLKANRLHVSRRPRRKHRRAA